MLLFCLLAISGITHVFGSCATSTWSIAYSSEMCTYSGGTFKMKCNSKNTPNNCGMRLDGKPRLGQGTYQASMKAAPGPGMNTAFYLFSYGRNNDKSKAWNEIDIEILGNKISNGQTKVWTNLWTGHYTQHGQLVTLDWDASKGYHTYAIKIDSSKIYWIFDGHTKRTLTYTGYSDVVDTVNTLDFQAEMALWGSTDGSWPDMGSMNNNNNNYPLYAYFKSVKLNKCSNCGSSSGGGGDSGDGGSSGSSGSTSGKIKITNQKGSNQWWYAVVLSEIPDGVGISYVKMRGNGQKNWEKGTKEYDYYKFTKYKPYSGPIDFKIKTTNKQTITSYDVIANTNAYTSGYMDKSVSSKFTVEDEPMSQGESWAVGVAITLLCICFIVGIFGAIYYYKKKNKPLNDPNNDMNETNPTPNTPAYDMSPIDTTKQTEQTQEPQEIEVEVETQVNA